MRVHSIVPCHEAGTLWMKKIDVGEGRKKKEEGREGKGKEVEVEVGRCHEGARRVPSGLRPCDGKRSLDEVVALGTCSLVLFLSLSLCQHYCTYMSLLPKNAKLMDGWARTPCSCWLVWQ